MNLDPAARTESFRAEVRAWLAAHAPTQAVRRAAALDQAGLVSGHEPAMSLWTWGKIAGSTTLPSSSRPLKRLAKTGPGSKSAAAARYCGGGEVVAWPRSVARH